MASMRSTSTTRTTTTSELVRLRHPSTLLPRPPVLPPSLLFLLLSLTTHYTSAIYLENMSCAPHLTTVSTDRDSFRYYPLYVQLHRCSGANSFIDPLKRKCAARPAGRKLVELSVIDLKSQEWRKLSVWNHTSCTYKCIKDRSSCTEQQIFNKTTCSCQCKATGGRDVAGGGCKYPYHWNPNTCSCRCRRRRMRCGILRDFNSNVCACTCKPHTRKQCTMGNFDERTCLCYQRENDAVGNQGNQTKQLESSSSSSSSSSSGDITDGKISFNVGTLILIATVEFFVLCLVFILLFYYFCFCKIQDRQVCQVRLGKLLDNR